MNRERFQRMKRGAYFINIGRGMTTTPRRPGGRRSGPGRSPAPALDVFEQEPLPADHPLWTMPGVLITPHTAGFGPYLDDRRLNILLDNAAVSRRASPCAMWWTRPRGSERSAASSMAHEVVEGGLCLFARTPDLETDFITRARARYWDFKPYRDEQWRLAGRRAAERHHGAWARGYPRATAAPGGSHFPTRRAPRRRPPGRGAGFRDTWAVERGLQLAAETVFDIGHHRVSLAVMRRLVAFLALAMGGCASTGPFFPPDPTPFPPTSTDRTAARRIYMGPAN